MSILRGIAIAGLLAVVPGCKKDEAGDEVPTEPSETSKQIPPAPDKEVEEPPATPATADSVEKLEFEEGKLPEGVEIKGEIERGLRFADKNGDNWVVFAKKTVEDPQSSYLYVKHYAIGPGGLRELRHVRDKVEDCDFDLVVAFDENSIAVTDLDDDAIGEVTFAYELGCTSDVSPNTYKLLVLEGGDKYILRGNTRTFDGQEEIGGDYKVDPSFEKGPPEFLAHAKKIWPELSNRR